MVNQTLPFPVLLIPEPGRSVDQKQRKLITSRKCSVMLHVICQETLVRYKNNRIKKQNQMI